MKRRYWLGGAIASLMAAGCGTTTSTGTTTTSTDSGWSVVATSGTVKTGFQGGATDGTVTGSFDIYILPSDTNVGWAVGNLGEVLKTTDGGSTSADQTAFPSSSIQRSVRGVSSSTYWVSGADSVNGGSSIFATTNGGTTWSVQYNTVTDGTLPARTLTGSDRINQMDFSSSTLGWAAGGLGSNVNIIWKTTNGTSWSVVYNKSTSGTNDQLQSIFFVDTTNGYAVGNTGVILKSTDAGATWTQQTSGTTENLYEVRCYTNADNCFIAGGTGTILKTTNGGTTWTALSSGTTKTLAALEMVGTSKIWVGGDDGTILYSSDGGSTWKAQTSNTLFHVQSIFMVSESVGWAACSYTASNQGALLKTTTGGS